MDRHEQDTTGVQPEHLIESDAGNVEEAHVHADTLVEAVKCDRVVEDDRWVL
jgi:hypothetical protein